ncbi:SAF domain-containing protein [Arthrobacter sp. ov118]|uniref:SAF domain-containing protein n=1 Tax=Arthrobacter sp. ov118 TaxID=1761747 RepID=UPI0008EDC21A|nr:SAF domain-containing protein [Arthrobacter sp. ov118]SFT37191.1 SAF-like [Arthrobacter sp. ov118]
MSGSAAAGGARLKKPSWKDPRLLVGILLVLASVAGVVSLVGAADQTTEAYAAREPIAVGETLTADKLHRVKVRLGDVEQGYLTPESGLDTGLVAVQRIGKDQLLPRESVGQLDVLNRKPVAVTVEESLPSQAVAGSRVDVWVALPDARNGFSEPTLLLSGAEIAQITAGSTALGSSRSTVVMILVPDAQMPKLLGAQANKAKIAVVWNPGGTAR